METKFAIFVFSFNRGKYLENCILSIKNLTSDIPIYVIDDGSTDTYTKQVLNNLSSSYGVSVVEPSKDNHLEVNFRTGGLYSNMSYALNYSKKKDYENVLFIQDDMQITRQITQKDIENFGQIFQINGNKSFMLKTCFFRAMHRDRYKCKLDQSELFYFVEDGIRIHFSDTGVFNIKNFFNLFPGIQKNEEENNRLSQRMGLITPLYSYPFMHWVPFPEAHRGKTKNWKLQLLEYLGNAGLYPIKYMSKSELQNFFERDLRKYPIAEDWLYSPINKKIWSTTGGHGNLIAQSKFKSFLSKILIYLHIR